MSVQITKQDNFTIININENTPWEEFYRCIHEYDETLYQRIYGHVLIYDCDTGYANELRSKVIYFCSNDNSFFTIYNKEDKIYINKRTIYDENNPYPNKDLENEEDTTEYDKSFHIDDKSMIIDTIKKEYALQNVKHGLYHHSTFYGKAYNSEEAATFKKMLLNKDSLLEMAQDLIEDIKGIKNIETIIDLKVFEIIPVPGAKELLREKI